MTSRIRVSTPAMRPGEAVGCNPQLIDQLLSVMEQEIVPQFYTRSSDGLPRGWLKMMKRTMTTCNPVFNTNRMVQDYTRKYYLPM